MEFALEGIRFAQHTGAQEYAADAYGYQLSRKVQEEISRDSHFGDALSMCKYCIVAPVFLMTLIECVRTARSGGYVSKSAIDDAHPCGYERRRPLEALIRPSLYEDIQRFIAGVNFFLYRSVPAYFHGYTPAELSVFVSSPLFDLPIGSENVQVSI